MGCFKIFMLTPNWDWDLNFFQIEARPHIMADGSRFWIYIPIGFLFLIGGRFCIIFCQNQVLTYLECIKPLNKDWITILETLWFTLCQLTDITNLHSNGGHIALLTLLVDPPWKLMLWNNLAYHKTLKWVKLVLF